MEELDDDIKEEFLKVLVCDRLEKRGISKEVIHTILPNLFRRLRSENYDMSFLDKVREDVRKAVYIMMDEYTASKKLWNDKTNLALYRCLLNFHSKNEVIIPVFSGACRMTRLDGGGRIVYLISDCTHSFDFNCPPDVRDTVLSFLKSVFYSATKFIDFFYEGWHYDFENENRRYIPNVNYISNVYNDMLICADKNTSRIEKEMFSCVPNTRIHYADIRNVKSSATYRDMTQDNNTYIKFLTEFFDHLDDHDNFDKFYTYFRNLLEKDTFIVGQLKKVKKEVADIIVRECIYYMYTRDLNVRRITEIAKEMLNDKVFLDVDVDRQNRFIDTITTAYFTPFMDIYLLCRMFAKYNVKNSHDPEYCRYIMVYAGNYHTGCYYHVLTKLGFRFSEEDNGETSSCLRLKNIKQPLFMDRM